MTLEQQEFPNGRPDEPIKEDPSIAIHAELEAMKQVIDILLPLTVSQQSDVVRYAIRRLGVYIDPETLPK